MTTKRPDFYAILGVPPSATQAEISHAYRTLLRRHHPDTRVPADESQGVASDTTLQQVLAAYTVLHDPALRADYDRGARPRIRAVRQKPQQTLNAYGAYGQPPIVAGPVCWHRVADPPSP
jgi:curved DNA-binding protein CbpA